MTLHFLNYLESNIFLTYTMFLQEVRHFLETTYFINIFLYFKIRGICSLFNRKAL